MAAPNRKDQILKRISENLEPRFIAKSDADRDALSDLIKEGLVKKSGEHHFELTGYGEIIQIMGYAAHQKKNQKPYPDQVRSASAPILIVVISLVTAMVLGVYLAIS